MFNLGPQVRFVVLTQHLEFSKFGCCISVLLPLFGAWYLPNLTKSVQVLIRNVVDLTSIPNFVNLT
jgi:hypothetical protein